MIIMVVEEEVGGKVNRREGRGEEKDGPQYQIKILKITNIVGKA